MDHSAEISQKMFCLRTLTVLVFFNQNCSDNPPKGEVLCSETGANTGRKRQWGIYDEAKG